MNEVLEDGTMPVVTPYQKKDLYVDCPACGKGDFKVSHLKPDQGCVQRYCESCGAGVCIDPLNSWDFEVEVVPNDRRESRIVVLESSGPVRLIVEVSVFVEECDVEEELEDLQYYYNEQICPQNYMPDVLRVVEVESGDQDPHGIFEFKRFVTVFEVDSLPDECPYCSAILSVHRARHGAELWSCGEGCEGPWFKLKPRTTSQESELQA